MGWRQGKQGRGRGRQGRSRGWFKGTPMLVAGSTTREPAQHAQHTHLQNVLRRPQGPGSGVLPILASHDLHPRPGKQTW